MAKIQTKPKRQRQPSALIGRRLDVHICATSRWCGYRRVKCVKVQFSKRTGIIASITVATYCATTDKYDGKRIKLKSVNEWTGECKGILWRKKCVPIETWLTGTIKTEPVKKFKSARAARRYRRGDAAA